MEKNNQKKEVKKSLSVEDIIKKKQEELKALKKKKVEQDNKKIISLVKRGLKVKDVKDFEKLVKYLTNDPQKHEDLLKKVGLDIKIKK